MEHLFVVRILGVLLPLAVLRLATVPANEAMSPTIQEFSTLNEQTQTIFQIDTVERLEIASSEKVAVYFTHHAAVYFLIRNHDHFEQWYTQLKKSRDLSKPVRFTYTVFGQELTSVEFEE
jgi:hypothetical protein